MSNTSSGGIMNNEVIPYNPHPNEFMQSGQNFAGGNNLDQHHAQSLWNGQGMTYPASNECDTEVWGSNNQWDSRALYDNAVNPNNVCTFNPLCNPQNGFGNVTNSNVNTRVNNVSSSQNTFVSVNDNMNQTNVFSYQAPKVNTDSNVNMGNVEMLAQGECSSVQKNSQHDIVMIKPMERLNKNHADAEQAVVSEGNSTKCKPPLKIDISLNSKNEFIGDDDVFHTNNNIALDHACNAVDQIFFGQNFVKDLMEFSAPTPIAAVHPVLREKYNSNADQSQQ